MSKLASAEAAAAGDADFMGALRSWVKALDEFRDKPAGARMESHDVIVAEVAFVAEARRFLADNPPVDRVS